ncbi:MAG: transglutaminase-like domain-containing protein [Sedimenticola sp.]
MKFQKQVKQQKKLTSSLQIIASGPEGVYQTLKIMKQLVRAGKKDIVVRSKALELTRNLNQKDWLGEVKSLHRFVRDNIRYIKDIRDVETVAYPDITLQQGQGDCDDKSVLLASLLESIGHPTRFVAVGFRPHNYSHVYLETKIGNTWLGLETTEPVEVGWQPKGVMARMEIFN